MIPEDSRRALARTRAARDTGRAIAEQAMVLLVGAAALLLLLMV